MCVSGVDGDGSGEGRRRGVSGEDDRKRIEGGYARHKKSVIS